MKWIRFSGALLVAVAVGAGAFLAIRALRPDETSPAAGLSLDEVVPSASVDGEGPLFDGIVNGIRIFPSSPDKSDFHISACDTAPTVEVDPSTAYGTDLDFTFPDDWKVEFELATSCGGTVVVFHRELNSPIAGVQASRTLADPSVGIDAPADQVTAVTLNGKPAAFIAPKELAPGYFTGATMFIVRESFGLTLIKIINPDMAPYAFDLAEQVK
jgi:hypothetical protein